MFKLGPLSMEDTYIDEKTVYDLIIIGAGPAGYTAGVYSARGGWKTLIIDKLEGGGLTATTHSMENYPGFPEGIDGAVLMEKFKAQALRFGTKMAFFEEVIRIQPPNDENLHEKDRLFQIHTATGKVFQTHTILIATGSAPKHLNIPGEREFLGRGVAYCITCDGPLYKDRTSVIVGTGNSGMQESLYLVDYATRVIFVEYLPYSNAESILQERVFKNPKVKVYFNHVIKEIKGEKNVKSILIQDRNTSEIREIPTDAVFIYIGYLPMTGFLNGVVDLDDKGYIRTDDRTHTSVPGIFAAGDARCCNPAQTAIAVGDGARAALAIREYLKSHVNPTQAQG